MSGPRLAVPPGRAGRLWLVQRLRLAHRATDLLDRKLRLLAAELERLRPRAEATRSEWEASYADAQRWLLRAVLLGGERAVALSPTAGQADVHVSYTVTMGARHPAAAHCVTGQPSGWEGPAVAAARAAHCAALDAAVQHAAAAAALAAVEAEVAITRYRLRAIRDRWVPRLQQALAQVEFSLEEQERADAVRLRRAVAAKEHDACFQGGAGEAG